MFLNVFIVLYFVFCKTILSDVAAVSFDTKVSLFCFVPCFMDRHLVATAEFVILSLGTFLVSFYRNTIRRLAFMGGREKHFRHTIVTCTSKQQRCFLKTSWKRMTRSFISENGDLCLNLSRICWLIAIWSTRRPLSWSLLRRMIYTNIFLKNMWKSFQHIGVEFLSRRTACPVLMDFEVLG